jgi:serine/threonine protein kinase
VLTHERHYPAMAKILIVDDDRVLAETMETWLTFEKHTVTAVHTGFDGWEQLQKNEHEIALLDWDLPDVNGIDILRRFRESGGTMPIIMLTGHTSVDDKEAGLDSGANDYLTKPFHMKELSARIRAALRTQSVAAAGVVPSLGKGNAAVLKRGDLEGTRLAATYEFVDVLGEGGSAIVFKAKHPKLDKFVAVKMLLSAELKEAAITRFEREAKLISQINHYNVIDVFDYGVTERGRPYMVMEYIKGESLQDKIEREGQLPLVTAAAILIQACRGLQEAHSKGIIHRDLKPENILLQEQSNRADWVKIVDFGIAHLAESTQERLTKTGTVVGTVDFLAPERLRNVPPDARADLYSLGVILFEMLTARPLFEADTTESLLVKVIMTPTDPPSNYRGDIAPGSAFDQVVLKATEKNPDLRYQTATEMRLKLEQIYNQLMLQKRV